MPQLLRKVAQASYLDLQPKNLSTTILMWCDESNDLMWPGEGGFSAWTGLSLSPSLAPPPLSL